LEQKNIEIGKTPFRNDTCFITGAPLYNNAMVLKVVYVTDAYENPISYILVAPYLVHSLIYHEGSTLSFTNFLIKKKLTILESFVTEYPRNEFDAISLISNELASPLKKNIMKSISINGIRQDTDTLNNRLYTVNIPENLIYVGVLNTMYARDIIKYKNTNTVLFQCILIN
jgi:hypothetical protein